MEPSELLHHIVEVLEQLHVRYYITGSIASMAYGEARFTNDIDIVADLSISAIPGLVRAFPSPDYYLSPEAAAEAVALREQFNIIHPDSGLKIDIIIPKISEFDRSRLSRVQRHRISTDENVLAYFASPEDLILKKMEFYREGGSEKHLRDITGILKASRFPVDREYIADWVKKLDLTDIWEAILKRLSTGK